MPSEAAPGSHAPDLRRTMGDLVALSVLPAVWVGYDFRRIAESLAEVLVRTVPLDLIYVLLRGDDSEQVPEVVRSAPQACSDRQAQQVRKALGPLVDSAAYAAPGSIGDPLGDGTFRTSVVRFGHQGDFGALVACSRNPDFPTEADRVLLSVAANQAAIVIQRKRTEAALQQERAALEEADRRKTEFLATLGHELRNPLAPIRSGLELLKVSAHQPETVEQIRCVLARQTDQMVRLIDDLLDVSRITSGKLALRRCRVSLSSVVRSAVEASQPSIDAAQLKLTVALPTEEIELNADPGRLAQVLSNLLHNAAIYTPRGGRIWLTAWGEGREIAISVKDTGIGIPAEMQDAIFEVFTQIDRPEGQGHGGLGMGLMLVKRLVDLHEGTVRVFSDGDGAGSEFIIKLPIPEDAPTDPKAPPEAEQRALAGGLRVLIVDDNRDAAEMLAMLVEMAGSEVGLAYDGREALAAAERFQPDVVLMDLGMPIMDGYQAASHFRAHDWGRSITLVALTGWGQDQDKARSRAAGFDQHLVKPVEPTMLRALLADCAAQREALIAD